MRTPRTPLVFAFGACLGAIAAAQSVASKPLSEAQRTHLQSDQLQIVTAVRGLPLGVREALQGLFGSAELDIVDLDKNFQGVDRPVSPPLPKRRLIAAGCAIDNHCLVYYERAGAPVTRRVTLFHWTPERTQFEWGGVAPGGFATIDDVKKAIVSGAIKGGEAGPW